MPADPIQPNSDGPVDRLNLSVEAARGAQPSSSFPGSCICFEAEGSSISLCLTSGATCVCLETSTH